MSIPLLIHGECLAEMDKLIEQGIKVDAVITDPPYLSIPLNTDIMRAYQCRMGAMDKELICQMYKDGQSMRSIALELGTNHKLVSRVLSAKSIKTRPPLNLRGKKKFDCDIERQYNNMATHLRFDVSVEFLMQFNDFKKLKLLNEVITNRSGRFEVGTEWYIQYLEKFYNDARFNAIYTNWVTSGYEPYKKPSLDHIVSKSKGGYNDLDNLQFLTWFENRCKNHMTQEEWDKLKLNIGDYFV